MLRSDFVKRTLAFVGLLSVVATLPALAVNIKKPDWVVTLKTEEQKGVLNFKGSSLKDPVKVQVTYQNNLGPVTASAPKYESFWYNEQGKPIGQEKFQKYSMGENQTVLLRVEHKSETAPSQREFVAAAEASLRVYLDASLHKAHLPAISVPLGSFDEIEQAILQQNFSRYTPAIDKSEKTQDKLIIYLISYPEGREQYLRFEGQ